MGAQVGADIEAICSKCGDVWHVVVAVVGSQIAKVQCKQCNAYHRYKTPGSVAASGSRRKTVRKTSAVKKPPPTPEPLVEYDPDIPPRPYNMRESFAVRERIDHKKFGMGVVEDIVGMNKIQVFFPTGRRILAHERTDL